MKLCRFIFIMMTFLYVIASFGNISDTNTKLSKEPEPSWIVSIGGILVGIIVASGVVVIILNHIENKKSEKRERLHAKKTNALKDEKPRTKYEKKKIPELERRIEELENENGTLKDINASLSIEIEKLNIKLQKYRKKNEAVPASVNPSTIEPISNLRNQEKEINDISKLSNIIYLTVLEGPLVEAGPEHVVYYKAWKKGGVIYFEFVNNDRTKKAINNRTSIIEPFCEKVEYSKSPDDSEMIATITPGLLNDDYTVIDKAKIEYK